MAACQHFELRHMLVCWSKASGFTYRPRSAGHVPLGANFLKPYLLA